MADDKKISAWDRPWCGLNWLTTERLGYLFLILIGLVTRFYHLGVRAMSHDESLHALYSWYLYVGHGYRHDPMMHGPFLFHVTALSYFLFGDNDFAARAMAALAGVVLIGLIYLIRRWIGRLGALSAALLVTISPSLLYYSRYIRHDIFAILWAFLLIWAVFRYLEDGRSKWLYLMAAFLSFLFTTKEVSYIYTAILGSFLVLLLVQEWLDTKHLDMRILDVLFLIGTLLLPLATALVVKLMGWNPTDYSTAGIERSGTVMVVFLAISVVVGWYWLRSRWWGAAAVFYSIFLLFYTTFFTNGNGIATGMVGALGYWLLQQGVRRGSQPWYYYILVEVPLYEYLPLLLSLGGIVAWLKEKGCPETGDADGPKRHAFVSFLVYWVVMTFVAYSIAGEKMPWLTTHFAFPMALLGGWWAAYVLRRVDWRAVWQKRGLWLLVTVPVIVWALAIMLSTRPLAGHTLAQLNDTGKWLAALIVAAIFLWVTWDRAAELGSKESIGMIFLAFLIFLGAFYVRTSWMANYINDENVKEFLVYAHGSPDIKFVLREVDDISRRTVGDRQIKIAYDDDSTWPLEWYMRQYPKKVFYGANPSRSVFKDAPVVIVGPKNDAKARPMLKGYYRYTYRLIWWPIETYKNLTWKRIEQAVFTKQGRHTLWDVIFYRKYKKPLTDWPYVHLFYVYIKKDVANQVWRLGTPPEAPAAAAEEDPYAKGVRVVNSVKILGQGMLNHPRDVWAAKDGRVYVADSGNHRIVVFGPDGKVVAKWGSKGGAQGQFNEPWGVAVGKDGRVYVADTWNHRIQVFDSNGKFLKSWGSFVSTNGELGQPGVFWGPRDIAIDAKGNIYVTDTGNKRVQVFDPDGKFLAQFGGAGSDPGKFDEPVGLAIDKAGNVYVADTWNQRVQKFSGTGYAFLMSWPIHGWESQSVVNKPYLAVDSQNRVYASDPENFRILVFTDSGKFLYTFGDYGTDSHSFGMPNGVSIGPKGLLYVADADNNRVMVFPTK